jgi:hypothetical protein
VRVLLGRRAMSGKLDAGPVDDREWFARHHGRIRIRRATPKERRLFTRRHGFTPIVAVKRIKPGERLSIALSWPNNQPLPDAATVERLLAADMREATFIDADPGPDWFQIVAAKLDFDR